ncbi:MAG: hypothetical protein FWE34_05255, partial [Defluviitaleaceae bacterium]|nr:hypothetical protein [Defluviitaleaceae bacterium]
RSITKRGRRELSNGDTESYEYTVQVEDVAATNAARQQIREMLERVRDYNEAARIPKEASRQLEEAIARRSGRCTSYCLTGSTATNDTTDLYYG